MHIKSLNISPYEPRDRFQQKMVQILEAHDVGLDDSASWVLKHDPLILETTPVAYGPNGELVREKLKLTLHYTLSHEEDTILTRDVWAERHHHLNMSYELATSTERNMIIQDMQSDILQQMILQLAKIQAL